MDDVRLLQILSDIARKYAPFILNNQTWQSDKAGIAYLATHLARNDYLVLVGYVPPRYIHQTDTLTRDWSQHFLKFYDLFAYQLFRTLSSRNMQIHPEGAYQIGILHGQARDLLIAMADYLLPYLDARSHNRVNGDDHHIQIVLREVLAELGGQHINSQVYYHLLQAGLAIIHDMVSQPIYQQSLTEFKTPIIYVNKPPSAPLPRTGKLSPPQNKPKSSGQNSNTGPTSPGIPKPPSQANKPPQTGGDDSTNPAKPTQKKTNDEAYPMAWIDEGPATSEASTSAPEQETEQSTKPRPGLPFPPVRDDDKKPKLPRFFYRKK